MPNNLILIIKLNHIIKILNMAEGETVQNIYDEIEIDDMDFEEGKFYYPCPCGDKFQITLVSIL